MSSIARTFVLVGFAAIFAVSCIQKIDDTPLYWRPDEAAGTKIPDGYKYYTLLINTSVEYRDTSREETLQKLKDIFEEFGAAIGDNNLAVWMSEPGSIELSVSLGKYYADLVSTHSGLELEYSNGPFLVLTEFNPDDFESRVPADSGDVMAISFAGVQPDRVIDVLNHVEARIRRNEVRLGDVDLFIFWTKLKSWWSEDEVVKDILLTFAHSFAKEAGAAAASGGRKK